MAETVQTGAFDLRHAYSPIRAQLAQTERIFDEALTSPIGFVNELCEYLRGYRGKMLRPAMLLLTGEAAGGLGPRHAVLGAVVEMVHIATLVHDDVLDDATHRRRRKTVRCLEGNSTAVLLGDYLISHAFHLCSSLDSQHAARRIGATTNTVCEGELLQSAQRGNLDLTEDEYFEIIRRKTGALTAVACELGAWCAGASPELVKSMHACGMAAGVAFQIIDDVLDLVGDEQTMGKTLRLDVSAGQMTLPLIHCLSVADAESAQVLRAIASGTGPGAARLVSLLERYGSIDYAVSVARCQVRQAVDRLEALPPSPARDSLSSLAEFITQRQT